MIILPHDIPNKAQKRSREFDINYGNTKIDWPKLAPQIKDKTVTEAAKFIGCSLAAVQNAKRRGWITTAESKRKMIDWSKYEDLAKDHTTYELAKLTGMHVRTIQRAQADGLIRCKKGQPNGL